MTGRQMTDREAVQMMRRAADEIRTLRRINAELGPRADAYDSIKSVLNLMPRPSQGYGEDVAWLLEKRIAELEEPAPTGPLDTE